MAQVGYDHWKEILQDYRNYNEAFFALISIDGLDDVSDDQKQDIIDICREDDFLMSKDDIVDIVEKWEDEMK